MTRLFADTSYWMALLNPRDGLHEKALVLHDLHLADQLVTTDMVLTELLNSFCEQGPALRRAAAGAVETLRRRGNVRIFPQTSEQFERAFGRYQAMADKSWSLTDCASFLLMEAESIRAALTHDHHFLQAGFEALLR
jgi:predicted nucleic acid-binding protein